MLDVPADEATIRRMVSRYEALLPTELPRSAAGSCRTFARFSSTCAAGPTYYLLTGNTRGGARAKLTHYDLFTISSTARSPRTPAIGRPRPPGPGDGARGWSNRRRPMFVVGDTPHDIECANAIGARTVAVATGGYTREELESHRPWRAFDELPAAEEFARSMPI